jgi:hypothetical protein
MSQAIRIQAGAVALAAELNDSPTAAAVAAALPLRGTANRWGEEIYFRIPVDQPEAGDARTAMAVGELAYWPPGQALCIFFGRTPASTDDRPRAASPVNPLGRVLGDVAALAGVPGGAAVLVEKA